MPVAFKMFCCLAIVLVSFSCSQQDAPAESTEAKKETSSPAPPAQEAPAPAASTDSKLEFNLDERGRALQGYDAVTYHTDQKAVMGSEDLKTTWGGATWHFSSQANLDNFKANPSSYAPANGGYCTFGIVIEKRLDGNPQVWHYKENQLYLFLNEEVKTKFLQDESGNLAKVNDNWNKMLQASVD